MTDMERFVAHVDESCALLTKLVGDLQDFFAGVSPSLDSCVTLALSALRAA